MPSASLHFRLPEDEREFRTAQDGPRFRDAFARLDAYMRNRIKYADISEERRAGFQEARDELHRILEEYRVEVHE